MPNVAGREFPYTPEGLQAAEQYRQALGMRNGGAMGFRPLGYANGGGIPTFAYGGETGLRGGSGAIGFRPLGYANGGGAGSSSVMHNGQEIPRSFGQGQHYVELAYLTPAEQTLLGQVDMYDSNPPHPGPAGIPNFNGAGGGGGGGGGDGDGGMEDAVAQGMAAAAEAEDAQDEADAIAEEMGAIANQQAVAAQAEADDALAATLETFANITPVEEGETELDADAAVDVQTEEEAAQAEDSLLANLQTYANIAQAEQIAVADAQAQAATTSAGTSTATALADAIAGAATGGVTGGVMGGVMGGGTVAPGDFGDLDDALDIDQIDAEAEAAAQAAVTAAQPSAAVGSVSAAPASAVDTTADMPGNLSADLGAATVAQANAAAAAANVGVAHDANTSLEQQIAEMNQITPYGNPVDSGQVAQEAALATLALENEAMQAAYNEGHLDVTGTNLDIAGQVTAQGATNIGQDIGSNPVAQGWGSPGAGLGTNSEVAQANLAAGRGTGVSADMIATLNATDAQGYAINNPQPTAAGLAASQVAASLNPTLANVIFGVAGLVPGPVGIGASIAGALEGRGLLGLAQQAGVPGAGALSDIGSSLTSGINTTLGNIGTDLGTTLGNIGTEFGNFGTSVLDNIGFGDLDFSTDATFGEDDDYAGDDAAFGGAEPDILPPPVEEPEPGGGQSGADNPLYGDNPLTYTITDLDPYKFTTSPATMYPNLFKDGGMIGFRPLGYANGGMVMANDGTMSPRPLGYANGGMPRGYDNGGMAVPSDVLAVIQELKRITDTGSTDELRAFVMEPGRNADLRVIIENFPQFGPVVGPLLDMFPSSPAPGLGGPVPEQFQQPSPQMMMTPPEQFQQPPPQMMMTPPEQFQQPPPQKMMTRPPPQMRPPQMPPPQVPMAMNRGGIMSLRHM